MKSTASEVSRAGEGETALLPFLTEAGQTLGQQNECEGLLDEARPGSSVLVSSRSNSVRADFRNEKLRDLDSDCVKPFPVI